MANQYDQSMMRLKYITKRKVGNKIEYFRFFFNKVNRRVEIKARVDNTLNDLYNIIHEEYVLKEHNAPNPSFQDW